MAFTKITADDLVNKGVVGLADTPNLSTVDMQKKFDEIATDVIVPKHNDLIDELEDENAAASLGAVDGAGNPSTVQAELNGIKQQGYTKTEVDALLSNKVDTEPNKGLSTFDFNAGYKAKLDGIEDNANNYVLPKGTQSSLGGVMGDGTTFTIDSNGVGHAVGGGGGGGTTDYNALINKPEMNGKEVIGIKTSEEYGILRPYLLVTSDAGSTITITKGTETITATQKTSTTWEVHPTSYGLWTIHSTLSGADEATSTITIDAVKTYSATVSHISASITVTYPSNATYCKCLKGSTEYVATSNPHTFTVRSLGTWTIETEVDGIVKTTTATISADGDSQSVTIEYADITVTYGNQFRGTTITCTDGTTTYTKTAPSSGNTLVFTIPTAGSWVVSGSYGGDTYSQTVVVSTMTSYTATINVFNATITVTFPYSDGATCTISDGTTTLIATTSPMAFSIPNAGTWQATATLDGVSKNGTAKVITTDGQTETDTIEYGEISLIYDNEFRGESITCVNGGTTITKTAPVGGNTMTFYPPVTGTWVISGTYSGTSYSTSATVTSLSTSVSAILQTTPDGSTVTPTDDIQTWLACAGINDKSYTTLSEVLADSTTLLALMSDNNAVDYLVRSKTWASSSANGLVPTMTDDTHPSGTASASINNDTAWKAFDNDNTTAWNTRVNDDSPVTNQWIEYQFPSAVLVKSAYMRTMNNARLKTFKYQAYNGSSWVDISSNVTVTNGSGYDEITTQLNTTTKYSRYRLYIINCYSYAPYINDLQFYSVSGIPDNSTAMTDIGANNYCANTLLADSDWCTAICNSTYLESVLNVKAPTMTGYTTPSGEVFPNAGSSGYTALWKVFDNDVSTRVEYSTATYPRIGYKFPSATKCIVAKIGGYSWQDNNYKIASYRIQGSNDNSNWTDLSDVITNDATASGQIKTIILSNVANYLYYALYATTGSTARQIESINFYARADV